MRSSRNSLNGSIRDLPYGFTSSFKLFDTAKNSLSLVQRLSLQRKLPVHNGCVNSICWNERGEYLLSGSDDQHLCVTHGYNYNVTANVQTGHRANIFSARFLPNTSDNQVISCSGDGIVIFSDLQKPQSSFSNVFNCHFGTAYEIMTVPNDSHTFLSCGEDGTVRWFDLRIKNSCSAEDCKEDILINCRCAVTTLAVNPLTPYHLGVGCSDSSVRIFDRRMLGTRATGSYIGNGIQAMVSRFTVPEFEGNTHRITSLSYSPDGSEMLVSYSSDYIYLFDVKDDAHALPKVLKSRSKSMSSKKIDGRCKSSERPLMKRLRVRGDWSDTGPNARPESEATTSREQHSRSLHANLLQRMSDVLTRMFNNSSGSGTPANNENTEGSSAVASSTLPSATTVETASTSLTETVAETPLPRAITPPSSSSFSSPCSSLVVSPKNEGNNSSSDDEEIANNLTDIPKKTLNVVPSKTLSTAGQLPEAISEVASVSHSLQQMKQELSSTKEKGSAEPVFNLTFSGHGVQSGVISIDTPDSVASVHSSAATEIVPVVFNEPSYLPTSSADASASTPSIIVSEERTSLKDYHLPSSSSSSANIALKSSITSGSSSLPIINAPIESNKKDDGGKSVAGPTGRTGQSSHLMETEESWESYANSSDDEDDDERENILGGSSSSYSTSESARNNLENPGPSSHHQSTSRTGSRNLLSTIKNEIGILRDKQDPEKNQLMNVPLPRVKCKFTGHRNARTMIKEATFWGDRFVMSGSDCGHIFVWDRNSTKLVMVLEADHHVVNCLQPHPFDPILASSGIDYDVKLWAPMKEEPFFDEQRAKEIMERNKVMLEETKDTITVPASFMIRMLASLNDLRSAGGVSIWRRVARQARDAPEQP